MWRSLVAHFVRDEGVAGSNPVIPTIAKIPSDLMTGRFSYTQYFSSVSRRYIRRSFSCLQTFRKPVKLFLGRHHRQQAPEH